MKKVLFICLVAILLLASCGNGEIFYKESEYSRMETVKEIKEGYVLDRGHSFDVVDTDKGYDITLHFVKEGDD